MLNNVFSIQVLWPYLLQTILPVQYTRAISPVCKSLAFLASKKREEEASDYQIDFTVQGEIAFIPSFINGHYRRICLLQ